MAAIVFVVALGPGPPAQAQDDDDRFRSFPPELVPGPDELGKKLVDLGALTPAGLPRDLMETFRQKGLEMFSNLTPEQQQNLANLANRYLQDRGIDPADIRPDQVPDFARDLQQQLQDDPALNQRISEFRERFAESQRQQRASENQSNQSSPDAPRSLPGIPGTSPRTGPGQNPPRSANPPRSGNPPRPSTGTPTNPPPGRPPGDPGTQPAPPTGNPDSGTGSANNNRFATPDESPAENPATPRERIGVRFDRLLLEAAQRGMESTSAETQSRLAGSINSLLDGLAENIDTVIRRHAENRARSTAGFRATPIRPRRSPLAGWNPLPSEFSSPAVRPWWLLILVVVGVTVWLLIRFSGVADRFSMNPDRPQPVRFRYRKIQTPEGLIASVDQFLLARFGPGASWWDVRRAQAALHNEELRRVSDGRIDELASAYELARYTSSSGALTPRQLERLGETLRELATDLSAAKSQPAQLVQ